MLDWEHALSLLGRWSLPSAEAEAGEIKQGAHGYAAGVGAAAEAEAAAARTRTGQESDELRQAAKRDTDAIRAAAMRKAAYA